MSKSSHCPARKQLASYLVHKDKSIVDEVVRHVVESVVVERNSCVERVERERERES